MKDRPSWVDSSDRLPFGGPILKPEKKEEIMVKKKAGNPRNSAKFMILGTIANLEQMGSNPKLSFYVDEKMDILKAVNVLKDIIKRWKI